MVKLRGIAAALALVAAVAAQAAQSDAARMSSDMMNPGTPLRIEEHSCGGSFKVLFYGNSIAMHAPLAKIGWTNDWGMAASAPEKDFVHLVVKGLEARTGGKADWRIRKMYTLERNIATNVATVAEIATDVAWGPDYVIIAIGENAPAIDESNAADYQRLLAGIARPFASMSRRPKIVMRSPFWTNGMKARCTARAAAEVGAVYVDAGPLGKDDENKAIGLFAHKGVANHPGDLGMRRLADLILGGFDSASGPISVQLRQTPGGPRIFVDGKAVRPRFFYGSPTCLCNISSPRKTVLKIPFASDRDTTRGRIALDGYPGVDPIWYSDAKLVDLTAGTTNVVQTAEDETNTLHYVADGLTFKKGHRYHYVFTHRATRPRTYFTIEVSYEEDGRKTKLPYYYGDTLGDTVAIAAKAEVDFVTFSSDSSWGCEGWWNPPEEPEDYSKIDREFERLVKINPKALLVPRIMTDAPAWLHARHPEMRMVYEPHCSLEISSVSSRTYRKAACEAVEGLSRHLREKFPRNYAGLQISGQNSAEWFYMLSQSEYLSGYDPATRDAFREWLKARGEADWATADVPAYAERRKASPPKRVVDFARFRNREMASFLAELGAAAKRGSGGNALTFFFYGYSWELGGGIAPETGHFDFGWLMRNAHGKIDGFSSPLSYSSRNLTGSTVMMSAAESVTRNGYLWFNEIDHRTHHEEMWDHMAVFTPYSDPKVTREMFMRDSAADILRGYGDWWMDLFGRGWFRDEDIWKVRAELNGLDDMMAGRKGLYAPQIASVVNEDSYFCGGCSGQRRALMNRKGFATCGADYGQYLLSDVLENPPASVKLFYLTVVNDLASDVRAKLEALKAMRSDAVFVENVTPGDITAEAIAARARKAGVHCFTAPGAANVCSAEGVVLVQALKEGPLAIDFGSSGTVRDALTGAAVCKGPKVDLPFRIGETRLFRVGE